MKLLFYIFLLSFSIALFSCSNPFQYPGKEEDTVSSTGVLIQADQAFSTMSTERGMKAAMVHFMAKEGVLLRPDEKPLIGADAIEYISQISDSGYKVSWYPKKAEISGDGTLGYTYGIYEIVVQDTMIKGTYINVWKKQNGEWRFMVNSGNQGIGSN